MKFNIHISESQYSRLMLSEDDDVYHRYSKNADKSSTFNISPSAACNKMKTIMEGNGIGFLKVGQAGILNLPGSDDSGKYDVVTQQIFWQWYYDVIQSPDSATMGGKSFEGLIGAIFGGEVSNGEGTSNKSDVDVPPISGAAQGYGISIKFSKSFTPSGGQLLGGIVQGSNEHFKNDKTGVKEELNKLGFSAITSTNISEIFNILLNGKNEIFKQNNIGKTFVEELLNTNKTFGPIDYFMFSTNGKINDVYVYQYTKDDIVKHMVNDVKNFNFSRGIIKVLNLSVLLPEIIIIKFPQFAKTKKKGYSSTKDFITTKFENEPTLALQITKIIDGKNKLIANVYRPGLKGEFKYFVKQTRFNDDSGKKINLTNKIILTNINEAITRDISRLEKQIKNKTDEQFIEKLRNYQTIKNRELYNELVKISDKGREGALQDVFKNYIKTMNPLIIQDIRKNPRAFIEKLLKVYGCDNGVKQIEDALKNVFNVNIQLPSAKYCETQAVQESVNKVLKTLNEAIEKKK